MDKSLIFDRVIPTSGDAIGHSQRGNAKSRHREEQSIPKNVLMGEKRAYKGYMLNIVRGDSRWTQGSMCLVALIHLVFSIIALAEAVQAHFVDIPVFIFTYMSLVIVSDLFSFWMIGVYAFNLYQDTKNNVGKALFRHYTDVFYVIPVIMIQTFYAFWALFSWKSAFGNKYVTPTMDDPSLPYIAYMRWNFAMLLLALGGIMVIKSSLRALHALKNVEMAALSYDTTSSTTYDAVEEA